MLHVTKDVSMKYFKWNISICFMFLKYFNGQKKTKNTTVLIFLF